MRLFETEGIARQYLEERIPPKEKDKEVDFSRFKEQLFDLPEQISPGHHEFEGANGYKVSFDLDAADDSFQDCWRMYKGLTEDGENSQVIGEYHPIYFIRHLKISTANNPHQEINVGRSMSITWMPHLRSVNPELSHNFSYVDKGEIYLIGKAGFFARPADLFSVFHEAGHVATRTPDALVEERNSVKRTYSSAGFKTEPVKLAALELQRERDANAWMLRKTKKIFADLNIPTDLVQAYVHHSQLKTYHEAYRDMLEEKTKEKE